MNFNKNVKQVSSVKVPTLMVLCKHVQALFCRFDLGQKLDFKNLSTLLVGSFLIEVTFSSQMSSFSRNLNHHWKCREQKENFQTNLVLFWNFTIF